METIYLKNTLHIRPRDNVVDLQAYRESRDLLLEGSALPSVLGEISPELPEPEPSPLERFTAWADAVASVVLAVGTLLVLSVIL